MSVFDEMFSKSSTPRLPYEGYSRWLRDENLVELQKKKITSTNQFSSLVEKVLSKNEKTLYLAIYNSNNQRSYITIKLK